jgi:hypothetical protein
MVPDAEYKKKVPGRGSFFLHILDALLNYFFSLPGLCRDSLKASQKIIKKRRLE